MKPAVSSIRIDKNPRHWRISVWNRGGLAGTLCVDAEDGPAFVSRLREDGTPADPGTVEVGRDDLAYALDGAHTAGPQWPGWPALERLRAALHESETGGDDG